MTGISAVQGGAVVVSAALVGVVPVDELAPVDTELSDRALLVEAARAALEARCAGVLGGPGLDEVALRRAARRAGRAAVRVGEVPA